MIKEVENIKIRANELGKRAGEIQETLHAGIELPFIDRYELEIQLYTLRLEQSKLNLEYLQFIKWAKEQK